MGGMQSRDVCGHVTGGESERMCNCSRGALTAKLTTTWGMVERCFSVDGVAWRFSFFEGAAGSAFDCCDIVVSSFFVLIWR